MLPFTGNYLYAKNLRYWLFPSRDILQSDWMITHFNNLKFCVLYIVEKHFSYGIDFSFWIIFSLVIPLYHPQSLKFEIGWAYLDMPWWILHAKIQIYWQIPYSDIDDRKILHSNDFWLMKQNFPVMTFKQENWKIQGLSFWKTPTKSNSHLN